jgi:hypothetical protein
MRASERGRGSHAGTGVVQPLGRDQQQVDLAVDDALLDLGPVVDVGGVERLGGQAHAPRGRELVAHERQQRRHDSVGPRRRRAAAGGDEVDRRLAPAGALHHRTRRRSSTSPHHRRRDATAGRSSRAATGWWSAGPARGRTGPSSSGACSGSRTRCRWRRRTDPRRRSWTFDLDPGGVDPVLGIPRLKDAYEARVPRLRAGHHRAGDRRRRLRAVVTNDFPQITLDLSTEWPSTTATARPDLYPEALRDEIDEVVELVYRDVNNGVYEAGFAGTQASLRATPTTACSPGSTGSRSACRPALPRRRHHHRGRRPAVHHPGPLRRRLPQPLQVQPQQADRDAGAVGLRPRPVPDPGFGDTIDFDHIKRTTTRSTPTSTRPASCRSDRTCPAGRPRTAARRSAAPLRRRHAARRGWLACAVPPEGDRSAPAARPAPPTHQPAPRGQPAAVEDVDDRVELGVRDPAHQ